MILAVLYYRFYLLFTTNEPTLTMINNYQPWWIILTNINHIGVFQNSLIIWTIYINNKPTMTDWGPRSLAWENTISPSPSRHLSTVESVRSSLGTRSNQGSRASKARERAYCFKGSSFSKGELFGHFLRQSSEYPMTTPWNHENPIKIQENVMRLSWNPRRIHEKPMKITKSTETKA